MKRTQITEVEGAVVFEIERHYDNRGFFQEVFSEASEQYHPLGRIQQMNLSESHKHVVRGLHVASFGKLCTCVRGKLFDVVVDVRKGSPTFGKWIGVWLTMDNQSQLYVPPGCAHGFFAAQNETALLYAQDGLYDPADSRTLLWNDSQVGINWPECKEYILSDKDKDGHGLDFFR